MDDSFEKFIDKKSLYANLCLRPNLQVEQQWESIMTSKQRAYLKSLANELNPIFQVGKASLTPEFTAMVGEAFNTKELIKIAVLKNCMDDPNEIGQTIAERTHSQVVQVIGKKIILYKPDRKNPKIILPKENRAK